MNIKHNISRLLLKKFQNYQYIHTNLVKDPSFDWLQSDSELPWLKLNIEIPKDVILNEIQNIQHLFVPHREDYGEHQGWESFCIHGRGYNLTREDEYYDGIPEYHWTQEAINFMPNTVKFFQSQWPGSKFQRVRVMKLKPGGYVSIHTDGNYNKLSPINIAITQPDQCYFVMENFGVVPYYPGSAFWLNITNRHAVFNDSNQDRYHIIVHQDTKDPRFQELVKKSYDAMYDYISSINK